jgi:hypothetical protein
MADDDFRPIPDDPLAHGSIPVGVGIASVARIPIPGTNGLAIELSPRGWRPPSGSTTRLFFQDITGKRHLRLDYDYNVTTKTIDYHWNQKGVFNTFGITNHAPADAGDRALYRAAKYFRYAGRILLVAGVAIDVVSIVVASSPMQRATEVVAGWAGAWAGCRVTGALGARVGMLGGPKGIAAGGIGGCIIGGLGGYYAGSASGRTVYVWAEHTVFSRLPEIDPPQPSGSQASPGHSPAVAPRPN